MQNELEEEVYMPACIADKIDTLNHEIERVKKLTPDGRFVEGLLKIAPEREHYPYLDVSSYCITIHTKVKNMGEVAKMLRYAADHDFRQSKDAFDGAESGFRKYYLGKNIHLFCHFYSSSEIDNLDEEPNDSNEESSEELTYTEKVCRYVQVGVKEVPVMELRCD